MSDCASTILQLRFEGANNSTTFVDSSPLAHNIIVSGEAKISTVQSRFGGSAGYFSGGSDSLEVSDNAFAISSGDFTIEAWIFVVYDESAQSYGAICSFPDNSDDTALFTYRYSEETGFTLLWFEGINGASVESSTYLAYDVWHHVACTCSGGTVTLFCNGIMEESVLTNQPEIEGPRVMVGNDAIDEAFFGYIGGLQVVAELVYNDSFTPPTEQFACGPSVFPALVPSSRTFIPGGYPHTPIQTMTGTQLQVLHSTAVVSQSVNLTFAALNESSMLSIRSHYIGREGRFLSFAIDPATWSGAPMPAAFTPTNYQWLYRSPPTIEDVGCNRYNVTVELEAVALT